MKKFSVLVICVFIMVALVGTAWAVDPFTTKKHTWTDEQTYRAPMTFEKNGYFMTRGHTVHYDSANKRFTIKGTEGNTLLIDVTKCTTSNGVYPASYPGSPSAYSAGATVYVPTVTKELDGLELTLIQKVSSTVTPFILYGTGINGGGSGSTTFTNNPRKILPMRAGDYIRIRAQYNSGVSWVITDWGTTGEAWNVDKNLTGTTTTGFSPDIAKGRIFYVNPTTTVALNIGHFSTLGASQSGTTVTLPTITRELDNVVLTFVNATSGTSEMVPYAGGLPIGSTSGTTPGGANSDIVLNGNGESVSLRAAWNSGVSWFIEKFYVHK